MHTRLGPRVRQLGTECLTALEQLLLRRLTLVVRQRLACAQHGVEGTGDLGVPILGGVLIEEGRGGGGVPEPAHRLVGGRAGGRGEGGAGVADPPSNAG